MFVTMYRAKRLPVHPIVVGEVVVAVKAEVEGEEGMEEEVEVTGVVEATATCCATMK